MRATRLFYGSIVGVCLAVFAVAGWPGVSAGQRPAETVAIDADDLGGVVSGPRGPEAGVWVIAETTDLPTKFVRMVVTDDRGRFVVPDLPKGNYNVWVRGYGLVDSPMVQSAPGKIVNLTATTAPNARAAAEYYPANYWYSLLQVPAKSEFPGTGPRGNGISPEMSSQGEWIDMLKTDGCQGCHQVGDKASREIPKSLGVFDSTMAAWERRLQSGQDGGTMIGRIATMGKERSLAGFANWTDRIAAGELPPAPPRPQGIERNLVVSMWDWATPQTYFHDEISSDKRNPTVNANGPIYGVHENGSDFMSVVDPVRHTATQVPIPVRDPRTPYSSPRQVTAPSPYWGEEVIWNSKANAHSGMMDKKGRLWLASVVRPPETPEYCRTGSDHPSAKLFPIERSNRQVSYYDPKTGRFTFVDTCFGTHHLMFAEDANDTLWFCGGGQVVGWLNTKMFDETGDAAKSQGWTALVRDANGNGKRDAYVEPNQPLDPTKDKRLPQAFYSAIPSPADNSIWGTVTGFPGALVRLDPGTNPPATALAEIYEVPWNNPKATIEGFSPRGGDIDRNGVVWASLASGHLASFDRRKCKGPLNGPTATGQHCPEGWTLHQQPGPHFKGAEVAGSADSSYYTWVDQFGTLGAGNNVPIATGNGSGSLLALVDGTFAVMRVPYPLGFHAKGLDGRIDDPRAGWKGRAVWSTYATRALTHIEGGKGTHSKAVKFQLRPNPLAK
ncbi:MAG TPA: carboxypeptidase-like regulatory domain-containing protein [Vicinamibacterales bacterium]